MVWNTTIRLRWLAIALALIFIVVACSSASQSVATKAPSLSVSPSSTIALTATTKPTEMAGLTSTPKPAATTDQAVALPSGEVDEPSNPGGPGEAVNLTGDATAGDKIFLLRCSGCHGYQGKGGLENPGSTEGTVPPLDPIDSTLVSSDYKTFATNIDKFIEHGSTPDGDNPEIVMTAFGDEKLLTPQMISNVIAYVISLNQE